MQLNREQIDLIERYLEQRELNFFDLKLELIDHISCEIENEMQDQKNSFEVSSRLVLDNWEPELKASNNWLLSFENKLPKFVVKNLFKKVLFHYVFVVVTAFITGFLFMKEYQIIDNESVLKWFKYMMVVFGVVYFLLKRKINQSKIKTTFSFQFDYFYFPLLLIFIYLLVFKSMAVHMSLLLFFTFNMPFAFYFYFKHFQIIKRYNSI